MHVLHPDAPLLGALSYGYLSLLLRDLVPLYHLPPFSAIASFHMSVTKQAKNQMQKIMR